MSFSAGMSVRFRAVEAAPWVAEVVDDGTIRPGRGDFDDLRRIEPGAVLHGVDQHLAERGHQQIAFVFWQRILVLCHEPHEAIGVEQMTRDPKRHLVR